MSGTYSKDDVSSHNKPDNLWIIVDDDVYDLTKFAVSSAIHAPWFASTDTTHRTNIQVERRS